MSRAETFKKIRDLLNDPKTTADDVAKVIAEDRVLSNSLKELIRSFGFPPSVCTLKGAVNLLGFDTIRSIVSERNS